MDTTPQTPMDRIREENLDYMRRYSEAVLMQAAQEIGMKIEITRDKIKPLKNPPSIPDYVIEPNKVWMNAEGQRHEHMVAQMAYWSDAVRPEDAMQGSVSFGSTNTDELPTDTPIERLAKKFESKFQGLGFKTMGNSHNSGFPAGFDTNLPKAFPASALVYLPGSLQGLVARAKNTPLGRFIASDPARSA